LVDFNNFWHVSSGRNLMQTMLVLAISP